MITFNKNGFKNVFTHWRWRCLTCNAGSRKSLKYHLADRNAREHLEYHSECIDYELYKAEIK